MIVRRETAEDPTMSRRRARAGFTLIDIFIVMLLVGVLAVVAMNSFRQQTMRARRVEAVVGLEGIYLAQQTYYGQSFQYGDTFDEIGFLIDGARRIDERTQEGQVYTFSVMALPLDGNPRGNFQGRATGDLDPGDGVLDILIIENALTVDP